MQRGFHVLWGDFLAAPVDHFLQPAGDKQKPFLVQPADVAGAKPAVAESGLIGRPDYPGSPKSRMGHARQFRLHIREADIPGCIHDRQLQAARPAHRSRLAMFACTASDAAGLGQAITVEHRNARRFLQQSQKLRFRCARFRSE